MRIRDRRARRSPRRRRPTCARFCKSLSSSTVPDAFERDDQDLLADKNCCRTTNTEMLNIRLLHYKITENFKL